jgi:hypothetical protein
MAGRVYQRNQQDVARDEIADTVDIAQSPADRAEKKSWWRIK